MLSATGNTDPPIRMAMRFMLAGSILGDVQRHQHPWRDPQGLACAPGLPKAAASAWQPADAGTTDVVSDECLNEIGIVALWPPMVRLFGRLFLECRIKSIF